MISPLSLTNPTFHYLNKTPQQTRAVDQPAPVGREQSAAPTDEPQSLHRMLPVTGKQETDGDVRAKNDREPVKECQTCKNRKYQDGSDDPGVSFKTPTNIDPDSAATAVRGHEQEHVSREQAKASREGRKVVSQSVTYHTAICPECGRVYISGGTTRTVTRADLDEPVLNHDDETETPQRLDVRA